MTVLQWPARKYLVAIAILRTGELVAHGASNRNYVALIACRTIIEVA
jgi:hypothetical protein